MAQRRKKLDQQYDLQAGSEAGSLDSHADKIVWHLAHKGHCIIRLSTDSVMLDRIMKEAKVLDLDGRFERTPVHVIDGLLGEEGSVRFAELKVPGEESSEALAALDEGLSTVARTISQCQGAQELGFELSARTLGLVHEAGMLTTDPPAIDRDTVMRWAPTFLWQRLMLVLFLGPNKGTLELELFDNAGDPLRLITEPGMLAVIRADQMWHRHSVPGGSAFALSCFVQQQGRQAGQALLTAPPRSPVAEELDKWAMEALEDAVDNEKDVEQMDDKWKYALEHYYHKGQQFAVRGVSVRQPATWDPHGFWCGLTAGSDTMTEVPYMRWDHNNYYHEHPEGWKQFKINVKHTAFCDGLELFDAKFFRIAPAETKSMDPMQRAIMEIGYSALYGAGRTAKNLLQSLTAVYVGCHLSEWPMIDQGPEEAGGCEQRSAGTGCAGSIMSNRFSFVFGMNGPSVTFDTDASSTLAAVEVGCVALDPRKVNSTMSACFGFTITLTPLTWFHRIGLGQMSTMGRCLTFDQSATGWVKAEGGGCLAIDNLTEVVDGFAIQDESRYYLGTFGACNISHQGGAASMGTPHGPAIQLLIAETCRQAKVSPSSIDAVECNGEALLMNDAVECASECKVLYGSGEGRPPLTLSAVKSNVGNGLQGSGMAQIMKMLYCQAHCFQVNGQHLRCLTPQLDEIVRESVSFLDEKMPYATKTSLVGGFSAGWGGTMAFFIGSSGPDPNWMHPQTARPTAGDPLVFWPAGGGGKWQEPERTYFIVGSWNAWSEAWPMEVEAPGIWSCTVPLGANRFEEFNILFDGQVDQVLHAPAPKAPSGSSAEGPAEESFGRTWMIDGRLLLAEEGEEGTEEGRRYESALGVGDKYVVRLAIAGKWRSVTWEKVEIAEHSPIEMLIDNPVLEGTYSITANWNLWMMEDMVRDDAAPGLWSHEVRLMTTEGFFQVIRNGDRTQIFRPEGIPELGLAAGPDPEADGTDLVWTLGQVKAGDVFRIEFTRNMEEDLDEKKVTWRKLRTEPLSEGEQRAALRRRYCIVGTFTQFRREEMMFDASAGRFEHTLEVGKGGTESFQILVDGDWSQTLSPNVQDANPHDPHSLQIGPNSGNSWVIGKHEKEAASAGVKYEVHLLVDLHGTPKEVSWKSFGAGGAAPTATVDPMATIPTERESEVYE
mmetsp:Transcript_115611/g.258317  ORF Transcript_115611/g.258317 Transcript_115611/m.258317 type:complete len:1168 (+) Transcript_115611:165-3668(+)